MRINSLMIEDVVPFFAEDSPQHVLAIFICRHEIETEKVFSNQSRELGMSAEGHDTLEVEFAR